MILGATILISLKLLLGLTRTFTILMMFIYQKLTLSLGLDNALMRILLSTQGLQAAKSTEVEKVSVCSQTIKSRFTLVRGNSSQNKGIWKRIFIPIFIELTRISICLISSSLPNRSQMKTKPCRLQKCRQSQVYMKDTLYSHSLSKVHKFVDG